MPSSLAAVLRSPIAVTGVALTTAAGLLFVFLVGLQLVGLLQNPYAGIVVFVMVPAFFTLGLVLIPVGVWIDRRREKGGLAAAAWPRIDMNDPAIRRMTVFLLLATLVNLGIVSIASFGAVEYTTSQQFCGQVCHTVMEPEAVAHQAGLHSQVRCVVCHVGPGAGGFIEAKVGGIRRVVGALTGRYEAPIPTPVRGLPDVTYTCETCHSQHDTGDRLRVIHEYASDEANTETITTLRMHVGGPIGASGTGAGIHWHMNRANTVEFVALDDQREQIPYVRLSTPDGEVREYFAEGTTSDDVNGRPLRRMDCLDCHSRPAHSFAASPEREVDAALGTGRIAASIPFVRRESVRTLSAEYPSRDVALAEIARSMREALAGGGSPSEDVQRAIDATQAIYRANVFPGMRVGWGTYVNQLGHVTSTGCFRCHDDSHTTLEGTAIRQDCELCHAFE